MAVVKRSWQDRLAAKQQPLKKKMFDEFMSRNGSIKDVIHLKVIHDEEGDVDSLVIESADCIPVIMPVWKDVPVMFLDRTEGKYALTSLETAAGMSSSEEKNDYSITTSVENKLKVDDLLVDILLDSSSEQPIVIVLQVKECMATFDLSAPLYLKWKCALYSKPLPGKAVDTIVAMAKRRLYLKY